MLKKINDHFYLDLDHIVLFGDFGNDAFYTLKLFNSEGLIKVGLEDATAIKKALDEIHQAKQEQLSSFAGLMPKTAGQIRKEHKDAT